MPGHLPRVGKAGRKAWVEQKRAFPKVNLI